MTDLEKSAGNEMLTGGGCLSRGFPFQKISVRSALSYRGVCAESACSVHSLCVRQLFDAAFCGNDQAAQPHFVPEDGSGSAKGENIGAGIREKNTQKDLLRAEKISCTGRACGVQR